MALALRQPVPAPAPQLPAPFVGVAEAAIRMRLTPGHLRRLCADQFAARGLAKCFEGVWGIHPTADPRLSDIESWRDRDLRQLAQLRADGVKPAYLAIAEARREVVAGFDDFESPVAGERPAIEHYLATLRARGAIGGSAVLRKCSWRTFYNWSHAYRQHGDAGGLRALVPAFGNGDGGGEDPIGPAAWQHAANLLNCGNSIRVAAAYTLTLGHRRNSGLESDPDWHMPGLRTFQREARRRRPKILRVMSDKGERAAAGYCTPHAQRDTENIPSNDEWVGDERTLDIMCRVPGARQGGWRRCRSVRVTFWLDIRSRMIVGAFVADFADSRTVAASLKRGIREHGKPRLIRCDNGRDYIKALGVRADADDPEDLNFPVAKALRDLGIEVHTVTPYRPQAKPIESFFRGMKEHLDKLFAGFWGGTPAERHEERDRWTRENLADLPTLESIEKVIVDYIDVYHRTPHEGVGMFGLAPRQAMEKFRDGPPRFETDPVLDHLFAYHSEPRTVGRDGVRFRNYLYGFCHPGLMALQGEKVRLRIHPDDASRATVCRIDTTPLFEVECAQLRGHGLRDLAKIARARSRVLRETRERVKRGRDMLLATSPSRLLEDRRAGIEALHGAAEIKPEHRAARLTIARPLLEEALSKAAPDPVEATAKAALRATGTDDAVADDESEWFEPDGDAPLPAMPDEGPDEAASEDWDDDD